MQQEVQCVKREIFFPLGIIGRVINRDLVCIAPFIDLQCCGEWQMLYC